MTRGWPSKWLFDLADDWGAALVDLGDAGHVNADSGFGPWPEGLELRDALDGGPGCGSVSRSGTSGSAPAVGLLMRAASLEKRVRIVESDRRTCPIALAIFLLVYVGALTVVFVPKETVMLHSAMETVEK
jgi:hypothetical protein